jgi:hypothetical protein
MGLHKIFMNTYILILVLNLLDYTLTFSFIGDRIVMATIRDAASNKMSTPPALTCLRKVLDVENTAISLKFFEDDLFPFYV